MTEIQQPRRDIALSVRMPWHSSVFSLVSFPFIASGNTVSRLAVPESTGCANEEPLVLADDPHLAGRPQDIKRCPVFQADAMQP